MGQWDDKFERAERRWARSSFQDYAQTDRVLGAILEDKARRVGNREVFRFRDEVVITFESLHDSVNRAANGFLRLGIRAGAKVALVMPNCAEFLYAWFGLNRIGAACVPINTAQKGDVLAHQIHHADCVAIVVDATCLPHVGEVIDRLQHVRHVVVVGAGERGGEGHVIDSLPHWAGPEELTFADLLSASPATPAINVDFRSLASISYTSGTTGPSKGVMISHHYWYEIWAAAVRYARYTDEDVLYTGLPFFHTSAHGTTGPAILAEARAVFVERFSASRMLDDCRRYGCTSAKYIGSIIPILMKQEPSPMDADNPLRLMVGAAAPAHLFQPFESRYNTRLLELYGMTECNSCLVNPVDRRKAGSCGQPITGYEVKVVDELDNDLPPGMVGEIVVRPQRPHLGTTGYYRDAQASLELFRQLWLHTGDLARTDDEGYFYFVDRKKQAIRRRGENISSFEVESVIESHPDVLESCVVGVPSDLGEEEVKAVVVLRAGASLGYEALTRWCDARMAYFAVPRYIAFRDTLPKTPSQRVQKYLLKAEGVVDDCWDRESAMAPLLR